MIVIMSGQQMTQISQDELLAEINEAISDFDFKFDNGNPYYKSLLSVVKRHRLKIDMNGYGACEECSRTAYFNVPWPCQTIQDIAEELK